MKRNFSTTIMTFVVLALCESMHAASQLAPVFASLVKYHETGAMPPDVDLSKVVPSEEIPAIIGAINSGNPILMDAAVESARSIIQMHINDEQLSVHQLQPPLADVLQAFQGLIPVVTAHFNDPMSSSGVNGLTDAAELKWKTTVVRFMDTLGSSPSPDMLAWMLKVIQWPDDGGRAEKGAATLEANHKPSQVVHDAMIETTKRNERETAFKVLPALAHLNPMTQSVMGVVLTKIDDSSNPHQAESAITFLLQNKSINRSEFADRMATKALDSSAPESVRTAARQAVDILGVASAKARIGSSN